MDSNISNAIIVPTDRNSRLILNDEMDGVLIPRHNFARDRSGTSGIIRILDQRSVSTRRCTLVDQDGSFSNRRRIERVPLLILVLLSLAASVLVIYATPWGPWAYSDSAAYLATARSLASGNGFQVLMPSGEAAVLMPPLYPLLLTGLHKLGFSLVEAARWLNVLLFGLTVFVVGLFSFHLGHSPWLAIPVGILVLSFPVMLSLNSGIMSEPPFLALAFSGLFMLGAYLDNGSHSWLIGAAIICALATLARFIGIALLPTVLLALLLLQNAPMKRRLGDLVIFTLIYATPTLIWAVWYTQRAPAPMGITQWSDAWEYLTSVRAGLVNVLWGWVPFQDVLPLHHYLYKLVALILSSAGVLSLLVFTGIHLYSKNLRRWIADKDNRLFSIAALFVINYLLIFVLIYLFRYPPQDINERTLLPLFPPMVVMLFSLFSLLSRAYPAGRSQIFLRSLPWLALVVGVMAYLPDGLMLVVRYNRTGEGYTSAAWRGSQTVKAVQELPPHIPIISNDTGAILFFTGRMAIGIGDTPHAESDKDFARYGDDPTDSAQEMFRENEAALVLFYPSFYWQLYERYQDETDARLSAFLSGLKVYGEYPDGGIYFYPLEE